MQSENTEASGNLKGGDCVKSNITLSSAALRIVLAVALVLSLTPSFQTTNAFAASETQQQGTVESTPMLAATTETCTVKFVTTDGATVIPDAMVESGTTVSQPYSDPEKDGYVFKGWYKDENCTDGQEFDFKKTKITEDTKIYAKWNKLVTITYHENGAAEDLDSVQIETGTTLKNLPSVTKVGYTFNKWTDGEGAEANEVTTDTVFNADANVYANWTANTYLVTYSMNGGKGEAMEAQTFKYDQAETQLTKNVYTRDGYVFKGWSEDEKATTATYTDQQPVQNLTTDNTGVVKLFAVWSPVTYQVNFDVNGGTGSAPKAITATYDSKDKIYPLATGLTKPGYSFAGWCTTDDGTGETYSPTATIENLIKEQNGKITLYAKWVPEEYSIVYHLDSDAELTTGSPTSYMFGEGVTLLNPTREHYTFDGWYTNYQLTDKVAQNDDDEYYLAKDKTGTVNLFASWTIDKYDVTFSVPEGVTAPDAQTIAYNNVAKTPKAPERDGYTFAGWYDGDVQFDFENTPITEAKELTAKWTPIEYAITYDGLDGATNSEKNPATYNIETAVTFDKATGKTGYTFDKWVDAEDKEVAEIALGSMGEKTVMATWTANTYTVKFAAGYEGATVTMDDQTLTYDDTEGKLSTNTLTRTGYTFAGWEDADGNFYKDEESVLNLATGAEGNESITLTAQWTANDYVVKFDDGVESTDDDPVVTGTMPDQPMTYDQKANLYKNNFVRAGYTFKDWAVDGGNKVCTDGEEVSNLIKDAEESVTLKAEWTPSTTTYTVKHVFPAVEEGGEATTVTETVEGTTGEKTNAAAKKDVVGFTAPETIEQAEKIAGDGTTEVTITYTRNTYSATFDMNGKDAKEGTTAPEKVDALYGATFAAPTTDPETDGYTFAGWYKDEKCQYRWNFDEDVMPAEGVTLYASWTSNQYTITFDANEGEGVMADQKLGFDEKANLNKNAYTKTGYTFGGWKVKDAAEETKYEDGDEVEGLSSKDGDTVTLVAQWKPITYTIHFDANELEGTVPADISATYDVESTVPEATGLSKKGYTVDGWNEKADGTGEDWAANSSFLNLTSEDKATVTVYAYASPNTYTVKFDENTGSGTAPSDITTTYDNTDEVFPDGGDLTKEGYTFYCWTEQNDGEGQQWLPGDVVENVATGAEGDTEKTVYAKWKANDYTVHFNANGAVGEVTDVAATYGSKEATYPDATKLTHDGYTFLGWSDKADATEATYTAGKAIENLTTEAGKTVTLYAVWQANEYTVSFKGGDGATGTTDEQKLTYDEAKALTKNGFEKTGYEFAGWTTESGKVYADEEEVKNLATGADGDNTVELTAQWTPATYSITYAGVEGAVNPNTVASYTYESDAITFAAPTKAGYKFTKWTDADNNEVSDIKTGSRTGDVILTANWEPATDTKYIVKHEREGVDAKTYPAELTEVVEATGTTGETTNVEAKEYDGFTAVTPVQQLEIAADGSTVIEIKYTRNSYYVTYDMQKHGTAVDQGIAKYQENVKAPTEPKEEGVTFGGWYKDANCNYRWDFDTDTMPAENITLYAKWLTNEAFTVNFVDPADGKEYLSQQVAAGGNATTPYADPTKDGYVFKGWYADETCQDEFDFSTEIAQNTTVYAKFVEVITITFDANGASTTPAAQTIEKGAALTELPEVEKAGYTFDGWYSGDEKVTEKTTFDASTTLTAKWTEVVVPSYDIMFNSNEGSAVASQKVKQGEKATKPADPTKEGYTFDGWFTDAACTQAYNFSNAVTENVVLYAKWTKTAAEKVAVYRLYNQYNGQHLFTTNEGEYRDLATYGWDQEGVCWYSPKSSSKPVYRLYNPYSGDHHYTSDANEYANLGKAGWDQEGIFWYSDETEGATPVYRLYNPYVTVGTHLYTKDAKEYNTLPTYGWKQEGVAFYAAAQD